MDKAKDYRSFKSHLSNCVLNLSISSIIMAKMHFSEMGSWLGDKFIPGPPRHHGWLVQSLHRKSGLERGPLGSGSAILFLFTLLQFVSLEFMVFRIVYFSL